MSEAANRPKFKLPAFLCRPAESGTRSGPPGTSFDETFVPKIELTAESIAEALAPPSPPPYQPPPYQPPDQYQLPPYQPSPESSAPPCAKPS